MKKILIYPLCLLTGAAVASTTFYYDSTGQCSGLFLNPNATSCSQAVTKITPPTISGQTFMGYWAANTQVIDSNGNILIDGTTAANLFDNTDNTSRVAMAGYTEKNRVWVKEHTIWPGYQNGWYACSGVQSHYCTKGGDLVLPYAPNCWSFGTNPQSTGYDYLFAGWRTADGTAHLASQSWSNPFPNGVAIGDSVITGGCTDTYLGNGSSGISYDKIYPFACKKFDRGSNYLASQRWVTEIDWPEGHGTWKVLHNLSGFSPGCTYILYCDENYHIGNGISMSIGCTGISCKSLSFDGTIDSLLTGTTLQQGCVQDVN